MVDIPFDVSYHFNENLQDVPNNPDEVKHAIAFLLGQLSKEEIESRQRIQLLGLVGVYARMLKDFATAQQALTSAIELSELLGDKRLKTANLIRLAHVHQWWQEYALSEALFEEVIMACQQDRDLASYLDFAYQHMGKCKFDQQQYKEAQNYFEQALVLRNNKGDQSLIDSTQFAIKVVSRCTNAS
jgi:tetratricopeptide (TPR) repeat protein